MPYGYLHDLGCTNAPCTCPTIVPVSDYIIEDDMAWTPEEFDRMRANRLKRHNWYIRKLADPYQRVALKAWHFNYQREWRKAHPDKVAIYRERQRQKRRRMKDD